MKQDGMKKFNKIFPLYAGLSSDLLFWVAIDTLFLTVVKKFNAAQIVSLTTVSLIACILLQVPLLKIIKKIGNTESVMQDLALRNVGKEGQQSLLTTMELSRKIVRAIMSLGFTMILVNNPMITVVTILFVLSIIEIIISIRLYKSVLKGLEIKNEENNNRNCKQTIC